MSLPPTFTAIEFRKAARSSPNQNCVRIARKNGWTAIWDDKQAAGTAGPLPAAELLFLTDDQFDAYQFTVRTGHGTCPALAVIHRDDGRYTFRATTPQPAADVELTFNADEMDAFHHGVRNHEFDPV